MCFTVAKEMLLPLVLVFVLLCGEGVTQDMNAESLTASGFDFYFGIPLTPAGQSPRYEIVIGTSSGQADYVVESSEGMVDSSTATSGSPDVVMIDRQFEVTSSEFSERMKGIRVYATGDDPIYVLVVIKYNFFGSFAQLLGYGSFPVHPNHENTGVDEYVYYAMSTDYFGATDIITNRRSSVLLVGNHDDTSVSITPTQAVNLPPDAQSGDTSVEVAAGTTHTITLDSLQTLGFSSLLDLTGTKIVSNKPLTVITGHQCGQIPINVGFCEPLYVHLPPTFNWGQLFLLAPLGGRTANQQYKYVTTEDSTTIAYRCGTQTSEGLVIATAGSGQLLSFMTPSYCYLTATAPIFVVQISPGSQADNVGDSAMAIIPHIAAHVKSSNFFNLLNDFDNSFITVTVQAEHFTSSEILLDGEILACTWINIYNILNDEIVGHGCISFVSAGTHTVSHSGENGILSVMAYGWKSGTSGYGYMYLTNFNFGVSEQPTDVPDVVFEETLPFFDLSAVPGVSELPRTGDSNSGAIFVPDGMIYGDLIVTQVYVNENGAFSFNQPWEFSHPNRYPTHYLASRQRHILSPFWSDVDIRKEGTVRYVPIMRGSSIAGDMILEKVITYVNERFVGEEEQEFRPTWLLVAQWDGVHPYPHGDDDLEGLDEEYLARTNTFQGVLITDGSRSYYVFSFTCGDIQWSGQGFETAIVGYNSNGDYFRNHPANGFPDIGQIISCTRMIATGGGRRRRQGDPERGEEGATPVNPEVVEGRATCEGIADFDQVSFPKIEALRDGMGRDFTVLPRCPPTKTHLILSPEFEAFATQPGDCHKSRNVFVVTDRLNDDGETLVPVEGFIFASVCCYEDAGALITDGENAGRITRITEPDSDITVYKDNCCKFMLCDRYTERRPVTGVQTVAGGTGHASGSGDPHYKTFDRAAEDTLFVDAGEYTLFGVTAPGGTEVFHFQGRLLPRGWAATTTVALAWGIPGVYAYQWFQNDEPVLLQTQPFLIQEFGNVNNDRVKIERSGNQISAFIKVLNIQITAQWHTNYIGRRYINFQIRAPRFLCDASFGHLGSCDGNTDNDRIFGADHHRIVPADTLFIYGNFFGRRKRDFDGSMVYTYTEEDRILNRRQIDGAPGPDFDCNSFENCSSLNFQPVRLEDLTFTDEERAICNNMQSCLYDLRVTGEEEFAVTTLRAGEESQEIQGTLDNMPPSIFGPGIFYVNVGEENVYTFTVNDTNDFTVTIAGGVPEGGVLNDEGNGVYTFIWTPPATPTDGVSFVATDIAGAATVHTPVLRVCACFNGGTCTEEGLLATGAVVQVLTCLCTDAYSGATCSEDRNGCADIECFAGVECFDIPAPGVGAECGSCETGFTGNGLKCTDLDECAENDMLCDQICENTFGSYVCTCEPGYELIDDVICEDIDECSGANDCEQGCVNTPGSYSCTCGPAFNLDNDGRTCNPRTVCGPNSCSHICAVDEGQDTCFCPAGLELAPGSTTTCQDIDECQRFSPCDQICSNTVGSFECSCDTGYQLQNDTQICEDINECREAALENVEICELNTECVNTDGSFECVCVDGYELVDGECQRIVDEVIEPPQVVIPMLGQENAITFVVETYGINELTADILQDFRVVTARAITMYCAGIECVLVTFDGEISSPNVTVSPQHIAIPVSNITNGTDGRPVLSFYAQLSADTVVSSSVLMMAVEEATELYRNARFLPDINECLTDNGGCNQTCTDIFGSFECSCNEGFLLAANNLDCEEVNECLTNNGGCNQTCTDSYGSFECSCGTGFVLATDNLDCDDVDECLVSNGGCNQTCMNTYGSHQCLCETGFTLSADNRNCDDINECLNNNGGCDQTCTNTPGSFECSCYTGFTLAADNMGCVDVIECDTNNGGCDHTCTNTQGSFECSCDEGYVLASDSLSCEVITTQPVTTTEEPVTTTEEPVTTTEEPVTTTEEPVTTTEEPVTTSEPCPVVDGNLYFMLNGAVYQPGSSILITDVGTANSAADADMSLICVTSEVNSQCCRGSDGGNAGEWYFPDGSIVPRARDDPNGDFTRSGFTEQVRLNRRNGVAGPTGVYTCAVPREDGCGGLMHTANISLGLPYVSQVQSFCVISLWSPPPGRFDLFAGYDIKYFNLESGEEIVVSADRSEFYRVTTADILELGPNDQLMVQVRIRLSDDIAGPYTMPVALCPTN